MISYAQNFEDVILSRVLADEGRGFYVDVGAWDPRVDSVTCSFYERGWRGINIEPEPHYFQFIAAARPEDVNLNVAAGKVPGATKLYSVEGTGQSTTHIELATAYRTRGCRCREFDVEATTLNLIFEKYVSGEVHFLKVDCEGSEAEVLGGLDLSKYRPWIILAEVVAPIDRAYTGQQLNSLVTRAEYEFVYFDGLNEFYLAKEHAHLAQRFRVPPNIFDGFTLARELELRNQIATLNMPNAPRSLKMVLPLARAIRRMRDFASIKPGLVKAQGAAIRRQLKQISAAGL